ncbi:MAG: hypothetical protein ACQEXJ_15020 [Myxococcota bacterium]
MMKPFLRRSTVALGPLLLLLVPACAEEAAPPRSGTTGERLAPPAVTDFSSEAWAAVDDDAVVVARVNGAPITRTAVAAAMDGDPNLGPREALDRLVEMEVLAQEGMRRELHRRPDVQRAWRQALAQTWLRQLEDGLSPEDIPLEHVRRIYAMPRVRTMYDHYDAWHAADLLIGCCDPKAESCDTEEVQDCYVRAGREIQEVYAQVEERAREAGAEGDPEAVAEVMESYRNDALARGIRLDYQEHSFYYQPDKPHDQQTGYNIYAEPVARTIIEAERAVIQEPVQSVFGWHILAKLDHDPEEHRGPDDPEVVADIRENVFDDFVASRFEKTLQDLMDRYEASLHPERLEALGGPVAAPTPGARGGAP